MDLLKTNLCNFDEPEEDPRDTHPQEGDYVPYTGYE